MSSADKDFDDVFSGAKTVMEQTYELEALADAFMATGNEFMARKLAHIASRLESASKGVSAGFSGYIGQRANASQEAGRNMVRAVIASHGAA